MEIAGYEIDNKYLAAGAAGLGILFFINRNQNAPAPTVATLQPADGLSWADVVGQPSSGLIGGTGESGPPGPPGPAGPPGESGGGDGGGNGGKTCAANGAACTKNRDCCGQHVCVDDVCTKPEKGNGNGGGGGGGGRNNGPGGGHVGGGLPECRTNDDCRKNEKCRHNRCIDRDTGKGRNDRNPTNPRDHNRLGGNDNNRPSMPNRNDNSRRFVDPPSQRSPREQNNRDNGDNRVFRDRENGNRVTIINRGGRDRERGRDANANASGGSVRRGDINGPGRTRIDVSGGRATANSRGGSGNVSGGAAKKIARKIFGRGGEVASNDFDYNGYGRMDGRGGQSSDYVNLDPQPGGTVAAISPLPAPMYPAGATTTIQPGESLRGVAKRVYGYDHFIPRLYTLNQDILMGRSTLQAGTVLKIG